MTRQATPPTAQAAWSALITYAHPGIRGKWFALAQVGARDEADAIDRAKIVAANSHSFHATNIRECKVWPAAEMLDASATAFSCSVEYRAPLGKGECDFAFHIWLRANDEADAIERARGLATDRSNPEAVQPSQIFNITASALADPTWFDKESIQ